jgi:Oligosaccharyltransferase subunit 5
MHARATSRTPAPALSAMDFSDYVPTEPFVPVASFPRIASSSLLIGFGATALFVAHQAIGTKKTRNVQRDIVLALIASVMLGLGLLFTMLANGVWF